MRKRENKTSHSIPTHQSQKPKAKPLILSSSPHNSPVFSLLHVREKEVMGISNKPHHQLDGEIRETTDGKKWVIAGITSRSPLKLINLSSGVTLTETEDQDQCPTTPTAVSVRIPRVPPCPPAPRKRKPSSKCSYGAATRDFFSPPDLETVFIQRAS